MEDKIPLQYTGAESHAKSEITLIDAANAEKHFEIVKRRFLDINSWELFAGEKKAHFSLRTRYDELKLDDPTVGDLIRIKIPILPHSGDGYDWVCIEEVSEDKKPDEDSLLIRVRPSENPNSSENHIAHFLHPNATSTFIIKRAGEKISAEVFARNEIPNTTEDTFLNGIRNKAVALGGMLFGSKMQWEALTSGLLNNEK